MKNLVLTFVVVIICIVGFKFANAKDKTANFIITADTNVSQVKGLSKYVTQKEVDSFALRHWNIANEDNHYDENETQKALRHLLEARQTDKVINFIKDNNLSVDTKLQANTTPLMYSAFYNDENTTKELIKLGANIRAKDSYKLSPMAYAIGNNSIETVKILLENGVKFDEVKKVQVYARGKFYTDFSIKSIEIDENNNTTLYHKTSKEIMQEFNNKVPNDYMFGVVVSQNFLEIAKMALESGYKPYTYHFTNSDEATKLGNTLTDLIEEKDLKYMIEDAKTRKGDRFDIETYLDNLAYERSLYKSFEYMVDYEPMLDLLLEHNISGQPSQKFMKKIYDSNCYERYAMAIRDKVHYLGDMRQGIDEYAEELAIYEYAKKHNLTATKVREKMRKERSSAYGDTEYIRLKLEKDGLIQRKSMKPTPFVIRLYDEKIERYAKYCGDKDLDFERDLVNWNDEIFKKHEPYRALFNWENKPIPETAQFKDIKEFITYSNGQSKFEVVYPFYFSSHKITTNMTLKEINLQEKEYRKELIDKHAQTLTEKVKFGSGSERYNKIYDLQKKYYQH